MKPVILIVENHEALRASLLRWLSAAFSDCLFLEAGCGEDAVALASDSRLDAVLMDVHLPAMDGIQTARQLRTATPGLQVILLTMHNDVEYRRAADAVGVSAYILKSRIRTDLLPALRHALSSVDRERRDGIEK